MISKPECEKNRKTFKAQLAKLSCFGEHLHTFPISYLLNMCLLICMKLIIWIPASLGDVGDVCRKGFLQHWLMQLLNFFFFWQSYGKGARRKNRFKGSDGSTSSDTTSNSFVRQVCVFQLLEDWMTCWCLIYFFGKLSNQRVVLWSEK